ncbi:ELMO/CED-12 family-domain-containing protein, partial [Dipodascopsis tothii]|uniref:ELMO/CED-12 family-domain-containing protein n=1 Tax=Dipodascopsis tothii TaxID=44089 RepID=UPI0034CF0164
MVENDSSPMTDIERTIAQIQSPEDTVRKMAIFSLHSSVDNEESARYFVDGGGLLHLRNLILSDQCSGNMLSYALMSFQKVLEHELGWEYVDTTLNERLMKIVLTEKQANIIRAAMSVIVSTVSHGALAEPNKRAPKTGYKALENSTRVYPDFVQTIVSGLSSTDSQLSLTCLQLLNAVLHDIVRSPPASIDSPSASDTEISSGEDISVDQMVDNWPQIIENLQDAGFMEAVSLLMQDNALPMGTDFNKYLSEFQDLIRTVLQGWRRRNINFARDSHKDALNGLYFICKEQLHLKVLDSPSQLLQSSAQQTPVVVMGGKSLSNNELGVWKKLGFKSSNCEHPEREFEQTGWLGLLDLTDYIRQTGRSKFTSILADQWVHKERSQFPFAQASVSVTKILCDLFGIFPESVPSTRDISTDSTSNCLHTDTSEIFKHLGHVYSEGGMFSTISDEPCTTKVSGRNTQSLDSFASYTSGSSMFGGLSRGGDDYVDTAHTSRVESHITVPDRDSYARSDRTNFLQPLLLYWSSLHTAGVNAFLRFWKESEAVMSPDGDNTSEDDDFNKLKELIVILFDFVSDMVNSEAGKEVILQVGDYISHISYSRLRKVQLDAIDPVRLGVSSEQDIHKLRRKYAHEVFEFVREQRIRCLLEGAWFYNNNPSLFNIGQAAGKASAGSTPRRSMIGVKKWKFVCLSYNRRQLLWGDYSKRLPGKRTPNIDELTGVIELSSIANVTVSA